MLVLVLHFSGCSTGPERSLLFEDKTDLLSKKEQEQLTDELKKIEDGGKYHLFIRIINHDDKGKFRQHRESVIASIPPVEWNNSILMYMVYGVGEIDIRTGPVMMNTVTDTVCTYAVKSIIPYFQSAEYYKGLKEGVRIIDSVVKARGNY